MKIAVDARELAGRPTGVGRYLRELAREWSVRPDASPREIVLLSDRPVDREAACGFPVVVSEGRGGTWWEQWMLRRLLREQRADVLFAPGYTAPLYPGVPFVVAIHDVSFAAHPEWFSFREGVRRRILAGAAARHAAAVITISDFSASELVSRFGIPRERITIARPGAPRPQAPVHLAGRQPLVLYVGSIFNRRHVPELIAALKHVLPHVRDARLVIVGENRSQPRQDLAALASRLGLTQSVEVADYVSEARLAELYSRARVFVFVSDYEGFGLTPLEALASGVPPVVADTAVAHETCGGAAVYVRPGDEAALGGAIRSLMTDEGARMRVLAAAPAVLARYSWEEAADQVLRAIERAARA